MKGGGPDPYHAEEDHPDGLLWTQTADVQAAFVCITGLRAQGEPLNLSDILLAGLVGKNMQFRGVSFDGTDFTDADLSESDFVGAAVQNARFGGASLKGANLSGIDLGKAMLGGVDLSNSNLTGTNLSRVYTHSTVFSGARYDTKTTFPEGFNPLVERMIDVDKSGKPLPPAPVASAAPSAPAVSGVDQKFRPDDKSPGADEPLTDKEG
jgi:uncharacterized protein YjbI with pentapeptide repeats